MRHHVGLDDREWNEGWCCSAELLYEAALILSGAREQPPVVGR